MSKFRPRVPVPLATAVFLAPAPAACSGKGGADASTFPATEGQVTSGSGAGPAHLDQTKVWHKEQTETRVISSMRR